MRLSRRFRISLFVVACVAVMVPCIEAANPGSPAVTFEKARVVFSGVRPGGSAVFFSMADEEGEWAGRFIRREAVIDDTDRDGVVGYDLKEGVPWRSIWAVVDLDTGAMIVATPEGYPRREITARTRMTPQPGSKGRLELIAADQSFAEILLVRQGRGAWVLSAAAGGPEDEDGPGNGLLTSRVSRMRAVRSNDPPPEEILPGDIIVIIDPDRMAFSADRVGGQP